MIDPLLRLRKVADDVRQILDEAKSSGSISLDQLDLLLPGEATPNEMEELIEALEARGIVVVDEADDEPTQEADDAAMLAAMRDWIATGNLMPQLTGEGWAKLSRAMEREKKATDYRS